MACCIILLSLLVHVAYQWLLAMPSPLCLKCCCSFACISMHKFSPLLSLLPLMKSSPLPPVNLCLSTFTVDAQWATMLPPLPHHNCLLSLCCCGVLVLSTWCCQHHLCHWPALLADCHLFAVFSFCCCQYPVAITGHNSQLLSRWYPSRTPFLDYFSDTDLIRGIEFSHSKFDDGPFNRWWYLWSPLIFGCQIGVVLR